MGIHLYLSHSSVQPHDLSDKHLPIWSSESLAVAEKQTLEATPAALSKIFLSVPALSSLVQRNSC